jgi:hypothetical protein
MLKIVTTPEQVEANINKFESELKRSPELQARLAYARAWYAYCDADSEWHFGPSKFVGYEGIDAKAYLRLADEIDGRQTEAHLQDWYRVVDKSDALYELVGNRLAAFLAKYGKAPSTKMRINVRSRMASVWRLKKGESDPYDRIVDLMVAVAKSLPKDQFQNLRGQLQDLWS